MSFRSVVSVGRRRRTGNAPKLDFTQSSECFKREKKKQTEQLGGSTLEHHPM